MKSSLCIYYDYWEDKSLKNIYNKGIHFKSNPRSLEYMTNLVQNSFDNIDIIQIASIRDLIKVPLNDYQEIVLAYPDSIGLGWSTIDNYVMRTFNPIKNIIVLNGRNRQILLNNNNLVSLKARRLLEKSLLPEIVFMILFIIITPFFLLKDAINGRY